MWLLSLAAAAPCDLAEADAPARLHLLSMAPGNDLFSSMGHTALVFSGHGRTPEVFDWGAYDASGDALAWRFVTGRLPYFLNRQSLSRTTSALHIQDRWAGLQRIPATSARVELLWDTLRAESDPAHRGYRYHWGTANCATRARDTIDAILDGELARSTADPVDTTARDEATRHLARWPVPLFAWRFITSSSLDRPLTAWDRMMIPEHLWTEVGQLEGVHACPLVEGSQRWASPAPPPRWPWTVPGAAGALAILASHGRPRSTGGLAILSGLVLCALGTASLVLSAASSLDGIGPTDSWLLAGPQSAVFIAAGIQLLVVAAVSRWLKYCAAAVAVLAGCSVPWSLVSSQVNGDIEWALLPAVLATAVAVWRAPSPPIAARTGTMSVD